MDTAESGHCHDIFRRGAIARVQRMPDFKEKLASQGVEPYILGPDQFAAMIKSDMAMYANIIKSANIKLDQ